MTLNDAITTLLALADKHREIVGDLSPQLKDAYATAISFVADHQGFEQPTDYDLPDADYTLADGAAWFTVKDIAIRIHMTDEGVAVDLYPRELEDKTALASAYAFFSEAENELKAYATENS